MFNLPKRCHQSSLLAGFENTSSDDGVPFKQGCYGRCNYKQAIKSLNFQRRCPQSSMLGWTDFNETKQFDFRAKILPAVPLLPHPSCTRVRDLAGTKKKDTILSNHVRQSSCHVVRGEVVIKCQTSNEKQIKSS